MQMVGAGRERVAGTENLLLEELAVGTVRPVESPANRHDPTRKSVMRPWPRGPESNAADFGKRSRPKPGPTRRST